MNRQIEILAPAGSYESMRAAMNAGCDAVYMGGSKFGARAYADNPDEDTLLKAIDEAHIRNKRLYLTVNTLIKEKEMQSQLYDFLEKYYLAGLDAVIVQDVGVMRFIHKHFPELPIHASTQTTLMMAQGAEILKSLGITRLVTARELSYKEIKDIRENTDLEIETFVHGALCYCYSGQCLMSSVIGGRSGNRGRCAQPCRMNYSFFSGGKMVSSYNEPYLLSPKDINTVANIPDLIEAGVDSFKIEGRMKRPEYAAGVSYIYRKYVDLYLSVGKDKYNEYLLSSEYKKDMQDLMDLYNRGGFSEGYGKTYHGKSMMSMVRPNHSGVPVGEVVSFDKGLAKILLSENVNAQDILEIRNKKDEPLFEFTVKDNNQKSNILSVRIGKADHKNNRKDKITDINKGHLVYRTKNNRLLNILQDKYINTDSKSQITGGLYAKAGERLKLTLNFNNHSVTAYHNIVETAIKQPMTVDKLKASIDKLGNSLFYFKELNVEADSNIFVPVAWLNEIRREAVSMLCEAVTGSYRREMKNTEIISHKPDLSSEESSKNVSEEGIRISVALQTKDHFLTALSYPEVSAIYVDYDSFSLRQLADMSESAKESGKELYILLPHICRKTIYENLKKDIEILLQNNNIDGFIVKNFEEVYLLKSLFNVTGRQKKIRLNHNMYIFNKEARKFWMENDIYDFTAPIELNEKELMDLGLGNCVFLVYGYLPLMVSAQCLYASTKGCSKCQPGTLRNDYLVDRIGKKFYVKTNCNSCYNTIYNGQRLSLLSQVDKVLDLKPYGIRLDFTYETFEEMKTVLSTFIDAFIYGRDGILEFDNITTGHFKRGVE